MNADARNSTRDALAVARAVDERCDRFEAAWRRGERPDLGEYLPADEPLRAAALAELAPLELELRLRAGESVRAEDYLTRFPGLRDHPDVAARLAAAERVAGAAHGTAA